MQLSDLQRELGALGLGLHSLSASENSFSALARGDRLVGNVLHIKANLDVCNFSIPIGFLDSISPNSRCGAIEQLLKINFRHRFGRVAIADVTGISVNRPSEQTVSVIICETMFIWSHSIEIPDSFQVMAQLRIDALVELADDVRHTLAKFRRGVS